jgi:eukaryotic-like serine/threonine-protein kinase
MGPDCWQRVEDLYHAVLEQEESERSEFLAEACGGDEALRREVESLLAHEREAEQFMTEPALAVAAKALAEEKKSNGGLAENGSNLVGSAISHYRILRKLGWGGMGVVYEAEDIKLGRRVAMKLLPEGVGNDKTALERFEREARAASALDHPNICSVYEFGEHGTQPFLVMPLLEGKTLKERIADGIPLGSPTQMDSEGKRLMTDSNQSSFGATSLSELLDVGMQITRGLEAAHQKGIIHRDIKPANIFVTTSGLAKILDFGLAKLAPLGDTGLLPAGVSKDFHGTQAPDGTPDVHLEPTTSPVDPKLTIPGSAIGTAGYMSPEQVRGESLDARTDLFSFGLVLYEMATGQQAFKGETVSLTRDDILNRVPRSARELNPEIPLELEAIINRALEKERESRYQRASELRADLNHLKGDLDSSGEALSKGTKWTTVAKGPALPRRWPLRVILASVTVVVSIGLLWRLRGPLPPPRILQTRRLTNDRLPKGDAIASDGNRLFFTELARGRWTLVAMPIKGGEVQPVPTPFNDVLLLGGSPDGSKLLFREIQTWPTPLWVMNSNGYAPHRLGEATGLFGGWSPDGNRIAWGNGPDVFVANSDGSGLQRLLNTGGDREREPLHLNWSPGGNPLRFEFGSIDVSTEIWEASASGTNPHPLLPGWEKSPKQGFPTWTPDGKYFIFVSHQGTATDQLWAIRENPGILHKTGEPALLTAGPLTYLSPFASRDGKTIFAMGKDLRTELARYDKHSRRFTPYLGGMSVRDLSFSRDGKWIAYVTAPEGEIWRSRVDGSEKLFLAPSPIGESWLQSPSPIGVSRLQWSPDGKRLVFFGATPNAALEGYWKIYLISADGGGPPVEVAAKRSCEWPSWSPDGNSLIFKCGDPSKPGLYIMDLQTHQLSTVPDSAGCFIANFTPDGRFIIANDRHKISLFDLGSQKWQTLVSMERPYRPTLSRDGRYVYFKKRGGAESIFRLRLADRRLEKVASLEDESLFVNSEWFSLAPDDSPLVLRDVGTNEIYALDVDLP